MQTDFYDKIQTLRNSGNPFAIATVIRAEKPTSAKMGAKAIVTEDGALSGVPIFSGGQRRINLG
jgi:xanthine dehydrogenase accessory factor